jgi:hypothetical protein
MCVIKKRKLTRVVVGSLYILGVIIFCQNDHRRYGYDCFPPKKINKLFKIFFEYPAIFIYYFFY